LAVPPADTAREVGAICSVGIFAVQAVEILSAVLTLLLPLVCPVADAVTAVVLLPVV